MAKATVPMSLAVKLSRTLFRLSVILAILGVVDVGGSEYVTVAAETGKSKIAYLGPCRLVYKLVLKLYHLKQE